MRRVWPAIAVALLLGNAAHPVVTRVVKIRPAVMQGMSKPAASQPVATPPVPGVLQPLQPYLRAFSHAAQVTKVPQSLLEAVALTESSGNPAAVSRRGAEGLMQVEPRTAHAMGVWGVAAPVVNILAGARYLAWLAQQVHLDGCWACAWPVDRVLSGYNAGLHGRYQAGYVASVRRRWQEIAA